MQKLCKIVLTALLLALATAAGTDDAKAQRRMSQGPDFSGLEKGEPGKGYISIPEKRAIDYMEKFGDLSK